MKHALTSSSLTRPGNRSRWPAGARSPAHARPAASARREAIRRPPARPAWLTVRALTSLAVLPAALLLTSAAVFVLTILRAPPAWIDRLYTGFGALCLAVAGTRVEVHGLEHIEPGRSYIVVANHESTWDPPVLVGTLRHMPIRFIIKDQLARVPILGPALLRSGNVRVERTNTAGDAGRIHDEMTHRRGDVSILFYAEGTRSRDGAFHPFKKGAFVTAIAEGLPVLPIATAGTYRLLPPTTLDLHAGLVVMEVGRPVDTSTFGTDDRDRLRDELHAEVGRLRTRARQRLRAHGGDPGGID